jgi:hypothetical protein
MASARRETNTHAGATVFLALLYERTGDGEARVGMERGVNAFKLGLERGIQKGNGQFLYCLSQVDTQPLCWRSRSSSCSAVL